MFNLVYIDNVYGLAHKRFKSDKEANEWVRKNGIVPIKLQVWSKEIKCFRTIFNY